MAHTNPVDALLENLEAERDALLSGNYAALKRIAAEREALLPKISGEDRAALDALRQAAARNQVLQKAAAGGVREAMRRLKALREAHGPIGGYTQSGEAIRIGAAQASVEHKA